MGLHKPIGLCVFKRGSRKEMSLCWEGKETRTVLGAKNKSFQATEAKDIVKYLLVLGSLCRIHLPQL